jgi:hypothetical protein
MRYLWIQSSTSFLWLLFFLTVTISTESGVLAASLVLNWQDNSTSEDGFKIERATNGSCANVPVKMKRR